ncbi:response regulator [Ramlibacter rhizophilus]|uniref:histidine kinase n=1 Tax=Ramlibacter rhizophilus TaxID=1781167 RepID=A0A4Z0BZM6_9BURK|nr:response regulator [Ramlibacter rhizophilus]TFZ04746.1 response regulator [Ramlibacter rhizophilus]
MNRPAPDLSVRTDSPAWPPFTDTLPYGLGLFDDAQRLVRCNPRFQSLLRLSDGDLQRPLDFPALVELTRRGSTAAQPGGLMLMDGRPSQASRKLERTLGDGTALEIHVVGLPDGGMAMTVLDAGPQRQAIDALRRSRAQSELLMTQYRQVRDEGQRAVEGRHRFAANMAHELRTPINAVLGMLQLIEDSQLDARARERLTHARDAARSLVGVVDDIMDFAAVEAGRVTLAPRPFVLEQLLRELAATFAATLGDRPQEFVFEFDPGLPQQLVGDDRRLRQILYHLGGNAIKFGNDKPASLRIALVERSDAEVTLDITVTDQGIGIEPEQLKSLMQEFGQADAASTRRFGGNGLGLAICRELLRLMGSELRAESQPGQGSRFGFRLRLPIDRSAAVSGAPVATKGLRVLVADSRPTTRRALVAIGQQLGWEVSEAESAGQMLDLLAQSRQIGGLLVQADLDPSSPFDAALRAVDTLPGRPLAVVVHGPIGHRERFDRLSDEQRRKLGAFVSTPATASLLAEALERAQGTAAPAARGALKPGGRPLQGLRILVAEDNENNQIVTRDLLLAQGALVEIAVDGLDTLTSIVANGQYDAILMDWQMPNMDGLEATREIRQIVGFQEIPIIALTANASAADRAACMAAGMNAHLSKPVDAGELVATLLRFTRPGSPVEVATRRPGAGAVAPGANGRIEIDRAGALARLGGDATLYAKVLDRFRQDAPRTLGALDLACQRGDRKEAHRLAHTLKGNAGTVGAQQLSAAARDAETTFSGAPSAADQAVLTALRQTVEATLRVLAG